jgi:hypothetical protein
MADKGKLARAREEMRAAIDGLLNALDADERNQNADSITGVLEALDWLNKCAVAVDVLVSPPPPEED